jgi:hypothetical protein
VVEEEHNQARAQEKRARLENGRKKGTMNGCFPICMEIVSMKPV